MKPNGIVTLLSDFGVRDPFVGVMKGAILARHPGAVLVDLTHDIEPGRIADGAFWLGQSYRFFPPGSVHLAVVDPGVGTARAALALAVGAHFFVGPDNGLFEVVTRREAALDCRRIEPERLGLVIPSRTFHGRDVFGPVAGLLAAGAVPLEDVGPPHDWFETEAVPVARTVAGGVEGQVLVVDRFGNLITNIEPAPLGDAGAVRVEIGGRLLPLVAAYGDLDPGACGAVVGSFGQLEVVRRDGSAADTLGAQRGTELRVHRIA
jgi:S-adenosylmethionine hydrolase